jgi:signal transduction histidine kinase
MTSRLIGLMSLVLLLSLAAFALVMNSYQAEVMDEVTKTISTVGKETLRTFEQAGEGSATFDVPLHPGPDQLLLLEKKQMGGNTAASPGGQAVGSWSTEDQGPDAKQVSAVVIVSQISATHLGEARVQTDADANASTPGGDGMAAPAGDGLHAPFRIALAHGDSDPAGGERRLYVQVDDVRAEADPALGTLLRIPTWRPGEDATGPHPTVQFKTAAPNRVTEREIVLPIPTAKFHDLFADFRRRTLFLFVGVFLVGTVLSASLAARFTRPIRRLDTGIRRLTDGDLEVQVAETGGDEIGRLGRAFNEMTRRLRASRERERELTRRERLAALGRLAAGVAHDVRNPLHSIGLTLENLQETARPEEGPRRGEFDRSTAIIREEIRRLDRLVENFLRFARSDRRARVEVDLGALLRDTADLVEKEAARRGVVVRVDTGEGVPHVQGDPESIRSSILNLVLNAFEAMPHGGALSLSVRRDGDEALVEVSDTGRGIPLEDQDKVFDFAYTTREDGHGLGLAMVHQVVVEDHGGRVSLASKPEEGTHVRLVFPCRAPELSAAAGA